MYDISLKLDKRVLQGKKARKLREGGIVPSVVYGAHAEPQLAQSIYNDTTKAVFEAGKHTPLNIVIDGKKKLAIVKSIDFDPISHALRHVAFCTIRKNDIITTEVPIELIDMGESPAERVDLVILQALESIEIKAKPADLPEALKLSVKTLAAEDDRLTVADIVLPEGVEFADKEQDMDLVIANVYEPSALQAANEAAGGEAEPEDVENVPVEGSETATEEVQAETKKAAEETKK